MKMYTDEMIRKATAKKETKIGKQRAFLFNNNEELIQVAADYKKENGSPMRISELRKLASYALVNGGIEEEEFTITETIFMDKKTKKETKAKFKEYPCSKALILEIFENNKDLYTEKRGR